MVPDCLPKTLPGGGRRVILRPLKPLRAKTDRMIKVSEDELTRMEQDYSGIRSMVEAAERADYPPCPHCNSSADVALVMVGVIGRTIALISATTRRKLIPNGDKKGTHYCKTCETRFRDPPEDG